jgi:rod shape-determining protein MreB
LRQHVALDVGTSAIRIANGRTPVVENAARIDGRQGLYGGIIVDAAAVTAILRPLLERTRIWGIVKPCVLTCAPSDATHDERSLLTDSVMQAGAASVLVIPEPLAAAVGAGIDVSSPFAQMLIDIGEGVTDCAVIRSSKIQASRAMRTGCCQMLKAATPRPALEAIADMLDSFLLGLPHETGCEIIESGICLTGGGALIPGVRDFLEQRTGIHVMTAKAPLNSVIEGARAILPIVVMLNLWR